jgi:hypothetical protein
VNCFPAEDHQILTSLGFLYLSDVLSHFRSHSSLSIACFVGGKLEYRPIGREKVIVHEGSHEIVRFECKGKSDGFELDCTSNHRLFVRIGRAETLSPYQVFTAEQVMKEGVKDDKAVVQFTGVFEEGVGASTPFSSLHFAAGVRSEAEFLSSLFSYGFTLGQKEIAPWVFEQGLGKERVRAVVQGLTQASGMIDAIRSGSMEQRDQIMRVLLHAGYSARFEMEEATGEYVIRYSPSSSPSSSPLLPLSSVSSRILHGVVWCVSVPSVQQLLMVRKVTKKGKLGEVEEAARPVVAGNTQVNDVSDRVHQLRQLEEEFKLKDVRIQQLETECSKYETQIQLLDQLITKQVSPNSTAGAPLSASLASPSPAIPAPSPTPPTQTGAVVDPNITPQTAAPVVEQVPVQVVATGAMETDAAVKSEVPASEDVTMTDASALPPAEAQAEPKVEQVDAAAASVDVEEPIPGDLNIAAAGGAPVAPVVAAPPAVPAAAPTAMSPLPGIAPLLPIPSGPNPSLHELLASIHSSTTTIANLQMALKLHEEQLESSNRQLIDRDRAMKYMQEQIERFSNLNHELNYKLKQSENLTLEERAKLEQSYKQILFAQKQKDEQATIIAGYEEKLKVFEQLLNVADVRATGAEENVAEMLSELKSTRMANQVLQTGYNKLLKEYERAVREKYAAMEEAHKIAETLASSGVVPPIAIRHIRQDSSGETIVETPRAPASPKQLNFGVKDEPKTPTKATEDHHVNGLTSPDADAAHVPHPGAHKFEFHMHHNTLASPSASSLASPGGSQSYGGGLSQFVPDMIPAAAAAAAESAPGLAAHYYRFNLLLTGQNKELSLKLNQITHHNTQLQMALVKLAHRPTKPSTAYIMNATAPAATPLTHTLSQGGVKAEHHSTPSTAMDVDVPSVPSLHTSVPLIKTSSGSRVGTTSSPLQTPKSPLPPLHPRKPVLQEELDL